MRTKFLNKVIIATFASAIFLIGCKETPQNKVVRVTGVTISHTELTLSVGDSSVLHSQVMPMDAANKSVSWTSSDKAVVEVQVEGKIKALKDGMATITVTTEDGGKTATCKVTVNKPTPPPSIDFELNGVKFEFVSIPAGKFKMGSPDTEVGRNEDEETQHEVTVSGFFMGKYEVTQAQWKAVMGIDNNPSKFKGDNRPVENVSWNKAQEFITKLNKQTGKTYRLPTEAEWEYACRAGTETVFNTGKNITTDQANYDGQYPYADYPKGMYRECTTDAGTFEPNAWGLYDMHGNVWEWCSDWYEEEYYTNSPDTDPKGPASGEFRVIRGGSWFSGAVMCRSARRYSQYPTNTKNYLGFRLVISQ